LGKNVRKPQGGFFSLTLYTALYTSSYYFILLVHHVQCAGNILLIILFYSTRANWRSTVNKDLQKIGSTLQEAEMAALDRHWMASECGPMCPVGCGMNQGQGHFTASLI